MVIISALVGTSQEAPTSKREHRWWEYVTLSDLYGQKISRLSGGEKTRLYLTKLMVSNPDLLILDEPTNHLDHDGLIYLEHFISSFDGGVLLVSHDRYFLDQTVTKIMVLDKQKISEYSGNYSFYKEAKDKEIQRQEIEYEKYMKKKKQLEEAARKQMERVNINARNGVIQFIL